VPLQGRVVLLEPFEARHEEPLWAVAQDARIWRWMRVRCDESRAAFRAWFDGLRAETLPFAQVVDGRPVGATSYLNVRDDDRVVEVGNTWLAPPAWGTGANAEAKLLLMEHAFEREGFRRVEFKTDASNELARAALAAIGATFEGVFRKHMIVRGGERRDSAWYAVIDEDWPEVKAALLARTRRS
jgi:N-acetyltransferase